MQYRSMGSTGIQVSEIGIGGEHLDRKSYGQDKRTLDGILDEGINILNLFMLGDIIRESIVRAWGAEEKTFIFRDTLARRMKEGNTMSTGICRR